MRPPKLLAAAMLAAAMLAAAMFGDGCAHKPSRAESAKPMQLFREVAAQSGLVFQHFNGGTGDYYSPEIVGSGVALIDFDGDGDLDVFLAQGDVLLPGQKRSDAKFPLPPGWKPGCRLFRNEFIPSGKLAFRDVTEAAGIRFTGMAMGAASADYDNDGRADLLITGFGRVALFHNNGDGTFSDVTRAAGVEQDGWSSSAAFFDYDRDGKLDLFVAHYLEFTFRARQCSGPGSEPDYCAPQAFPPALSRLFHNEGGGRFRDVTQRAGMGTRKGPGFGVVAPDLNGDGWPDLYVANDSAASYLWINQRDGTFKETGLESGVAFGADGQPQAGMGVSAGDFDNDGDEDLVKTNITKQGANLYRNDGAAGFFDDGAALGLQQITFPFTGFGAGWFDYDNDGWLDVAMANGAVYIIGSQRGQRFPYRQTSLVLHNEGGKSFRDVSELASEGLGQAEVSRSIAFGDLDNDGRVDMVFTANSGPARLYWNQTPGAGNWLIIRLEGTASNRDGLGSYVTVRAGGRKLRRQAQTAGSFLAANDPRVHFGLGAYEGPVKVRVEWTVGEPEEFEISSVGRVVTLKQGTGK